MLKKLLLCFMSLFMMCGTTLGMKNASAGDGKKKAESSQECAREQIRRLFDTEGKNLTERAERQRKLSGEQQQKQEKKEQEQLETCNSGAQKLAQELVKIKIPTITEFAPKNLSTKEGRIIDLLDDVGRLKCGLAQCEQFFDEHDEHNETVLAIKRLRLELGCINTKEKSLDNDVTLKNAQEDVKRIEESYYIFLDLQKKLSQPTTLQSIQDFFNTIMGKTKRALTPRNPLSERTMTAIKEETKKIGIAAFENFAIHEATKALDDLWNGKIPYIPFVTSYLRYLSGADSPEKISETLQLALDLNDADSPEEGEHLSDIIGNTMEKISKVSSRIEIKGLKGIVAAVHQCEHTKPVTKQYAVIKYLSLLKGSRCPSYKAYKEQYEKAETEAADQKKQQSAAQPDAQNLKDASTQAQKPA